VSAARGAREVLEALASAVPVPIASIATRACPTLPLTTEERVADNRAQTIADSVTYREALSTAAEARGWSLHWYDRERAPRDAAAVLGREDIDAFLSAMGRSGHLGKPSTSLRRPRRLQLQRTHKECSVGACASDRRRRG
jgi:hypothetical protein